MKVYEQILTATLTTIKVFMIAVNNDFLSKAAVWLVRLDVTEAVNDADRSM